MLSSICLTKSTTNSSSHTSMLYMNKYGTWHKKSYCLRAQIRIRVRIRAQLIIRKGAETGGATGVGKIRTDRSFKRQRSANCLRIPANTISYFNKLRKVRRSGVISRSLVRCFRYESSLKYFFFFAHRMSLGLAIIATQEEAGERPVCSYSQRNFKTPTFVALCPSSVKRRAISA